MSQDDLGFIHFPNANSRHTYFTVHKVAAAHRFTKGTGVKVGILDHCFAVRKYSELYVSSLDFVGDTNSLEHEDGHGYWMACALKEIAPECEVYALNVYRENASAFSEAIADSVYWAVENHLNVLTCPHGRYAYDARRKELDAAAEQATEKGIVTCFLHYDHPNNILPWSVFPYNGHEYSREPDINIWQYDYNTLFLEQYKRYRNATEPPRSGDEIPYYSASSTAVVTGGFVALLMRIRPGLPYSVYRQILIETSYRWSYSGQATFERGETPRVVDIERAVEYLHKDRSIFV